MTVRARLHRHRVALALALVGIGVPLAVYAALYVVLAAYSMFLLAPVALPALGDITGIPASSAAGLLAFVLLVLLFLAACAAP